MLRSKRAMGAPMALALLLAVSSLAEAQYVKTRVGTFSTNSNAYVPVTGAALSFTPSSASEVWVLLFSARLRSTAAGPNPEVRYQINGVEHGMGTVYSSAPNAPGPWEHFYWVTGTTATQNVTVSFRDNGGPGSTGTIEDLQMIAFKLPASADFHFAETSGLQAVAAGVWNPYQTLSFTPASAGDYVLLGTLNGTRSPGSTALGIRWKDPGSLAWPDDSDGTRTGFYANSPSAWQSFFLARVQTLGASPQTYTLEANGGTGGSQVRNTRLAAFRTDAFPGFASVQDIAETSTTSTGPVVKSTLNVPAPPSSSDFIVIQSLGIRAAASATDARNAGFETDDVVSTSYAHVVNDADYRTSFGYFDAVSTSAGVKYENTFSTSNAAFPVYAKESVIHVLRLASCSSCCPPLSVTEGATTTTVTALGSFEMTFDESHGGAIELFYDLAEDPSRSYDLAGQPASNFHGLFHSSMKSASLLYTTGTNDLMAKADLLEATPTRVRVRQESFYQRVPPATAILAGVKGIGDYSIYSTGKMGVHWNRRTTTSIAQDDHPLEVGYRVETLPDPRGNWTGYSESGSAFPAPAGDDFVLAQSEVAGARTDFLAILYQDWPLAERLDLQPATAFFSWRDTTSFVLPTGLDESWDFLYYFKPTTFANELDSAVTTRRDDFRSPDGLSFTVGNGWNENTADPDFFNQAEGAYTMELDPSTGLTFQMSGGTTPRYRPFFKIRQWRSLADPPSVTLAGNPLANDADFHADVKPMARSHFAQNLEWHSTMESAGAVTSPDVGSAGTVTLADFAPGRYGNGARFDADGEFITVSASANFDPTKGSIEFWYQPSYDYGSGPSSDDYGFFGYWIDANNYFFALHQPYLGGAGNLEGIYLRARSGGVISEAITGTGPSFPMLWRATEWVHLRFAWDLAASRLEVYVNGELRASAPYTAAPALPGDDLFYIGERNNNANPINNANGIIDEFRMYSDPDAPTRLAFGGLATNADEYLASPARNMPLAFTPLDGAGRGKYLYLGSDSAFRGLNVDLATNGAGTADLQWQYWNGSAWANLEAVTGFTDETAQLTKDGTLYWTADPPGWQEYSVNGEPDLYYVRAYLASGSYTTTPVENVIKTDILLFQYCGDILLDNQTFDFGLPPATAVELARFEAVGGDGAIELEWETASELDNLGFHLYRALSAEGPYERITPDPIPGLGSTPVGARYSYTDSGLDNGVTYFYQLEDIETTGRTERHGPVSATPRQGAGSPAPETGSSSGDTTGPTLITYGEPAANRLRVLSWGRKGALLELVTEGFFAEPQEDGTVRLTVPGFEPVSEAGHPSIPVKRSWVDAFAGLHVKVSSVEETGVETIEGLVPGAESAGIVATPRGTVRAARVPAGGSRRRSRRLFPVSAARVVSEGFQGDVKKVLVELAPLRWQGARDRLLLARRLVVRLSFEGRAENEVAMGGRRGRSVPARGARRRDDVLVRFATVSRGLHQVRYEDVFGSRARSSYRTDALRLSRLGETVAFHVEPDPASFGPGSSLYFFAQGAQINPYDDEAVYELGLGEGVRMEVSPAFPRGDGDAVTVYRQRLDFEENAFYQAGLLEAPDRWLWDILMPPASKRYRFELTDPASTGERSRISVWLQGASDFPASPDHHIRVYLNDALVDEVSWNGKQALKVETDVPSGVLREGENELELENVGDTEAPYSMVFLDRYRVEYLRRARASSGRLEGLWEVSGTAEVLDAAGARIVDVTDEVRPMWLSGMETTVTGSIRFLTEAGHRYEVVAAEALAHPEVRRAEPFRLRTPRHQADYVAIGPRAFLDDARPLLELRRRQGLRVEAVSTEQIYEEFGFGEARPEAIHDFLAFAYHEWRSPAVRYVVLLGDGTYDYKDYLGTGVVNRVPPWIVKTSYLWTASDPAFARVNGDDVLPDLAIGRLPAATEAELRVMVDKILAYEDARETGKETPAPLVLVTDNPDRAGDFVADAEELAAGVLTGRDVRQIRLGELGVAGTRSAIRNALDQGASLMSYMGHGGIQLWAQENVLDITDVASLAPQPQQPLLVTMNCLNGYFHFPYFNSLSEELLKAKDRGAIAAFSPTGLSLNDPAHLYHRALLDAVFNRGHARLGDAVLDAQAAFAETGSFPELLTIYHLLGDPALTLR